MTPLEALLSNKQISANKAVHKPIVFLWLHKYSREDRNPKSWLTECSCFTPLDVSFSTFSFKLERTFSASSSVDLPRAPRMVSENRSIVPGTCATFVIAGKIPATAENMPGISPETPDWGLQVASILDRKSTRLNSSHSGESRMPSSA